MPFGICGFGVQLGLTQAVGIHCWLVSWECCVLIGDNLTIPAIKTTSQRASQPTVTVVLAPEQACNQHGGMHGKFVQVPLARLKVGASCILQLVIKPAPAALDTMQ
jgi:hypothetical protein